MSAGLFPTLRQAVEPDWRRYVEHRFVAELGRGTLPEPAFRRYLGQDYLFLIQFARAWALAIYKSVDLAEMRRALASLKGILEVEMGLHVEFCRGWGMTEAEMAALPQPHAPMPFTPSIPDSALPADPL